METVGQIIIPLYAGRMTKKNISIRKLLNAGHIVVGQRILAPGFVIHIDLGSVESVQTVLSEDPNMMTGVLEEAAYVGVRQAIV